MFSCYHKRRTSLKGNATTQHLKKDDTKLIDICTRIDRFSIDHLGRHILGGPKKLPCPCECRIWAAILSYHVSNAEISQDESPIGMEEKVPGLDISVNDLTCVSIVEGSSSLVNIC
jgi:hypothetical protein